jgi:deazaflavin-dependent oxidoreductase (nitroreductase family)
VKRRIVTAFQTYLLNPPIKLAMRAGMVPPGYVLLETTGRKSGKRRVTPVGNGLVGDTLWIVTEHGHKAGYVRNLIAEPRVRVRFRSGWRGGSARVLEDDDPRERQRMLARGHPSRRLNAFVVRALGTEHLTIRIDLD